MVFRRAQAAIPAHEPVSCSQNRPPKVVILTSKHGAFDVRVFHKQARTLVEGGYQVVLAAPHPERHCHVGGVRIIGLPRIGSRGLRALYWFPVLWHALREHADIYQFPDLDLLPCGVLIQWFTRKPVIYDALEWYPGKMLIRQWIPPRLRQLVCRMVQTIEPFLAHRLAATITADHGTAGELRRRGVQNVVTIYNYPLPDLCPRRQASRKDRDRVPHLLFVGGIGPNRGIFLMLDVMAHLVNDMRLPAHLHLVGPIESEAVRLGIEERLTTRGLWSFVHLEGTVPHNRLGDYLNRAHFGLLIVNPDLCRLNIPTKLFEYMAAGLAVIATRAPMTAYYLDEVKAGVLIDSQDPRDYAQAVVDLWHNPDTMDEMTREGRRAYETAYNWRSEGRKLSALFGQLVAQKRR